jgi:hypothetical protein
VKNFIIIVLGVATIWVARTQGWSSAWWFVIGCGIVLAVVYSIVDVAGKFWVWLERKHEIHVHVYDQETDIVDAEVVEEKDTTKWWRV